ncbi:hypothetical protein K440DRAFT_616577 [Wilcoxina mikolae CBS 423.85]|nr:hypothetical protein K440DRAFT_616577 [Wilcoxina mikolae CBS 423.85]
MIFCGVYIRPPNFRVLPALLAIALPLLHPLTPPQKPQHPTPNHPPPPPRPPSHIRLLHLHARFDQHLHHLSKPPFHSFP